MDRKRILITGGTGFIGSYLKNHYGTIAKIFIPGHNTLDLTNRYNVDKFFGENEIDIVIHCALYGRDRISAIDSNIVNQNLDMFNNLWHNKEHYKKLINMGTANEFDTTFNIDNAPEELFRNRLPTASYGLVKNLIARICDNTDNMSNLRLFGVCHHTENANRFFARMNLTHATNPFHIHNDHYFDFFNLEDIVPVIDHLIYNDVKHINCVYNKKHLLSEYAYMFAMLHGINTDYIIVDNTSVNNFTGDGSRLNALDLKLKGITNALKKYRS